jgi:hypothetical protein
VDCEVFRYNQTGWKMDTLKYELLTEVNGRMQADLLKSYLEAQGVAVELFQEAVGHHIYPVMIDGLGRVQVFVPIAQAEDARTLLDAYNRSANEGG